MKLLILVFTSILLFSCGKPECDMCSQYDWGFRYIINVNAETYEGINVDTTGQGIDLDLIDSMTNDVIECLNDKFPNGRITNTAAKEGYCVSGDKINQIEKTCITVKVPDDWGWSCDKSMQLLKDLAPQEGCTEKGMEPTADCPCRWRAGVQGNNTIIVTPNLYLYKDPLVKILTGCWNPWNSKELSECMAN